MKISIIVPVYNKKPFLERCLKSIEEQYRRFDDVIIVDDGSNDGSRGIIDGFCNENGWRVFRQPNKGVSAARNLGLENAAGDYVTFLDADDVLMPDACISMRAAAESSGHANIIQFKQFRCKSLDTLSCNPYGADTGFYDFAFIPKYWVMVWNKIYDRSFLNEHKIRFREGMQFGEDSIFNAECILVNGGLYHARQVTVVHCLDDKSSICRGNLNLNHIERLDKEMVRLYDLQTEVCKRSWLERAINEHRNSKLYKKYGFSDRSKGKYDVVYFVKDWPVNDELKYSLRSLEQNFTYNQVWFVGGCPDNLRPDKYFRASQEGPDKWNKVRNMIRKVCENKDITDDFWLFNDDFFILKYFAEGQLQPTYNGQLRPYIERVERKIGGSDDFTERLATAEKALSAKGYTTLNYEVHKPILINKKKALEVLDKFPEVPAFRSLYGNYWKIGGVNKHDMKVKILNYGKLQLVKECWDFVSTDDQSFRRGNIGDFIREKFNRPSRFER